jgi:hypothetical protein
MPVTPNYGFNMADPNDSMANFETWLNANWDKLADIPAAPAGTSLPTAGNYNVGDRFYKSDTQSIYLLACKDANWGWHWRPIQDAISPWVTVPNTCMDITGWTLNPVPAAPFQIALDNRGQCYWRGIIGPTSGNISRNVSYQLFKTLPIGLSPREGGGYMLGHSPVSVGTVDTNLNIYQGVRLFLQDDFNTSSIRAFGGTADFNRVYLTGVQYAVGTARYTAV